jgi:hypothetical protein
MRYDDDKLKNDFEKPKFTPYSDYPVERERGGCLTAFLVFIIGVNVFFLVTLCAQYSEVSRYSYGSSLMPVFALGFGIQCVVLACAVALWNWKKWGYYGLMLGYGASFLIGLVTGSITNIIGAIVGVSILVGLVNDKLDMFD